jgi:RHS repeat-associated protein
VGLASTTGTVPTSYTYEPYGKTTVAGTASPSFLGFTGRENDSTGTLSLYNYRARAYSPTLQRFLTGDPIAPNEYSYTGNCPVAFSDPLGLERRGGQFLASFGLPSCGSIVYPGSTGYIAVQTVPQGTPGYRVPDASGKVVWGIYMYYPIFNYGHWTVSVQINGHQVDHKDQYYPPHGSIQPTDAPSGSVLTIQAEWTFLWFSAVSVPNACIVP